MLKAIFTIDCDFCREPFATALTCCDFEEFVWSSYAQDLTTLAQEQGWSFDQQRQRFLCAECTEQLEEVRNNPQIPISPDRITLDIQEAGWAHSAIEAYLESQKCRKIEINPKLEELEQKLEQMFEW
jgi:hypothetical protein